MLKTWIFAALGITAIAVIVWFAGPFLTIGGEAPLASAQARVLFAGALALVYGGQKLWQIRRARQTNEQFVSALASEFDAEVSRERLSGVLGELRHAGFGTPAGYWSPRSWGFWRTYVHQMPWYAVIGAPGSGKTTALLNAGLNFPLEGKLGRGAVGTRNCDWWFTDQAVLIDTAGRYTTQDKDRVADRKSWGLLLDLLRRMRPHRPLNGVLITISVSDLLELSADGVVEHARLLRTRLDELQLALHVRPPVYVLVTKCDLLPGFVDWFSTMNREDRSQPWGVTFDLRSSESAQAASEFATMFDGLINRLTDGLTARLEAEPDLQRRGRLFSLPSQLRSLGSALDVLVRRGFGPVRAAGGMSVPCLRGVYLCSGTQQGSPIDRTLAAFGRELGVEQQILPAHQGGGKSYFLARLFSDIVFAEAILSGRSPLRQRTQKRWRFAAIVALQLCVVAVATIWVTGYMRSLDEIAARDAQVTQVELVVDAMPKHAGPDPRALVPALNAMRELAVNEPRAFDRTRLKLDLATQKAYERMLLGAFQGRISKAIDASLRSGADTNLQYEALKAYTMLRNPAHFDGNGLKLFVSSYWDRELTPTLSAPERAELAGHLDALIKAGAVGSSLSVEPALVESVRNRLHAQSALERIALRLEVALDRNQFVDFDVSALSEPGSSLFVGADGRSPPRSVSGRYTIDAYRKVVSPELPGIAQQIASEAPWVLGSPRANAELAQSRMAYRAEYAKAWAELLDDLHVRAPASDAEAAESARTLGAKDGVLARLLGQIAHQTDGPVAPTDPRFARFVNLGEAVNPALQLFQQIATSSPDIPLERVAAESAQQPEPVRSMLLSLVNGRSRPPEKVAMTSKIAKPAPAARNEVADRLGLACIRLVAGHFPFDRAAAQDASLDDFSQMFAPQGAFDRTFGQVIAPHLDTTPAEDVERFRAAARIRDVFFPKGSAEPSIQLTIRPVSRDQLTTQIQLEVDGQLVRFSADQSTPATIRWPADRGSARIDFTPAAEGEPLEFNGRWALFRLLDHAAVRALDEPNRFEVTFAIGGRRVSFEVQVNADSNPFRMRELEHFDCPI